MQVRCRLSVQTTRCSYKSRMNKTSISVCRHRIVPSRLGLLRSLTSLLEILKSKFHINLWPKIVKKEHLQVFYSYVKEKIQVEFHFVLFRLTIKHIQVSELISVCIDWLSLVHSTPEIRLWSLKRMLVKNVLTVNSSVK